MALVKDKTRFAEMQALSRWLWAKRIMEKTDCLREIRDAAYVHANLQERENRLNGENDNFQKENGELGQFTKDGEIIKVNMEKLREERNKIAARIASKDEDYQELLE